jgi:glycosyltransferase involved in cell wall biosynthesis
MKIVIVGPAYPLRGGIAHHTGLLTRALAKRHDVSVITFRRQYPAFLFPGTTQKESDGELLRIETEERLDSINPFTWLAVAREIRRRKPDLVIFPYSLPFFAPCYGTVAALIRLGRPTRTLYLCHNIIPHERHPGDLLMTRFAFAFGDRFLVQSRDVGNDLLALNPHAHWALSPHPVYELFGEGVPREEARAALGISQTRVVLFFGYIRPYKGLGILLDAVHTLAATRQTGNTLLLVVGEFYEDDTAYRNQAEALGIGTSVRFVARYVPQRDVALYFSASDVVVLPYLSATQSGIAQLAYNFDRPLIVTRVGGLADIVVEGSTGYVVPPNDPGALADALRTYFEASTRHDFVAAVREEKKKYSWDSMVDAIEALSR